jgi:hypothetical protein
MWNSKNINGMDVNVRLKEGNETSRKGDLLVKGVFRENEINLRKN